MPEVVFQFSTSHEWQSALIRRLCHSPFSHVDLMLPDGGLLGASDSPEAPVLEGNPRGVAIRPPDYQDFRIRRQAILEVSREQQQAILELARSQLGKGFDPSALKEFLSDDPFDREWRLDEHWFCSELWTWDLESVGFFPYQLIVPKGRVSPPDFLMLIWPYMSNRDEFWLPPKGIKLGTKEIAELRTATTGTK